MKLFHQWGMENPVPVCAELHKCLPPLEGTMVWPLNKNKTWKILRICLEVTPNYARHALPFNTVTCQLQLRQPDIIHTNALFTNWSVGYINSLYKLGFNWLLQSATAKIHTSSEHHTCGDVDSVNAWSHERWNSSEVRCSHPTGTTHARTIHLRRANLLFGRPDILCFWLWHSCIKKKSCNFSAYVPNTVTQKFKWPYECMHGFWYRMHHLTPPSWVGKTHCTVRARLHALPQCLWPRPKGSTVALKECSWASKAMHSDDHLSFWPTVRQLEVRDNGFFAYPCKFFGNFFAPRNLMKTTKLSPKAFDSV